MVRTCVLFLLGFGSVFASEFSLELSRDKKVMIDQLMQTVATKEEDKLLAESQALMPTLMCLMQESPFKVIAYVCQSKQLKQYMNDAASNPVKWRLFEMGFSTKMMQEYCLEDFEDRLGALLARLSLTRGEVEGFIDEKDWSRFILYVLHNSEEAL